jgi:hypothetical protein
MRLRVKIESNEWYYTYKRPKNSKCIFLGSWSSDIMFFRPTLFKFFSGEKKKGFFFRSFCRESKLIESEIPNVILISD